MRKKIIGIFLLMLVTLGVAGIYAYDAFFCPAVAERFILILRADESYEEMTER